ncbi:hypothetical protein AK830_g826 [Neonectria ditissima]|uniref:Transmembrane protein 53 n=1 Tax=Neonectria ditissima TaxID=78410 RepID=A0A0P7BKD1_9HYPO|nr:hypothetical protein AK830_g826 [Neonectria ditissima]
MPSRSTASRPLAFMDKLGPAVTYFDPGTTEAPDSSQGPRLIMLLAWMNARDAHIAKYVAKHRELFPGARILVERSTGPTWLSSALRRPKLKPAMPVLRDLAAAAGAGDREPQFLVHIFSNGGVASARTLWELWASELGGEQHIPRFTVVMDSCPGRWSYKRDYHVAATSLPGWAWPVAHVLVVILWVLCISGGRHGPNEYNAAKLNSPIFLSQEVRRTYVYGTEDKTVGWDHVEEHGKEAKEKGAVVRMEKFEGGQHVSLLRLDAERYWGIIERAWKANE